MGHKRLSGFGFHFAKILQKIGGRRGFWAGVKPAGPFQRHLAGAIKSSRLVASRTLFCLPWMGSAKWKKKGVGCGK
jgi:hypothetical protein